MALKLNKKNNQVKKIVKKTKISSSAVNVVPETSNNDQLNYPTGEYTEGIGRRKVATARVRIYEAKGDFIINDMLVNDYFSNLTLAQTSYIKPFDVTGTKDKFSVSAKISGSGISSQMGALQLGIARALVKFDASFKPMLKAANLLTRDDRMKETRKIGTGGKARRKRQSPKR